MTDFLWRMFYAAICFVLFWLAFPLFLEVIGVTTGGSLLQLMKVLTAAIAVIYVFFGPAPPKPF